MFIKKPSIVLSAIFVGFLSPKIICYDVTIATAIDIV